MTMRDVVCAFVLADPSVAALIGTRLQPDMLPAKIAYPAVEIKEIDTQRPAHLRGVASLARMRLQFDVYAAPVSGVSSRGLADAVALAIRQRLDGFNGTLPDGSTSPATNIRTWIALEHQGTGVEPDIHGGLSTATADYFVDYQTHGGIY